MGLLVDKTKDLAEFLFNGYTTKQKRDNIRFLHGMTLFCLVMLFIFSPSRSWARWIVIGCFGVFVTLYITLKDCWISLVENEYESEDTKEDNQGVLIPMLNLTGHPITDESKIMVTSISYFYTIAIMLLLTLRYCYGIY